jgi:branched-chain amino acid transport system ATP-binding protein
MSTRLEVRGLTVSYGSAPAVRDISLELDSGEVVALLGPNGAGKTTTLLGLANALPGVLGQVAMAGRDISALSADRRARSGLVLVPDDRGVFHQLTVAENLRIATVKGGKELADRALETFPRLADKLRVRAGLLSGGEQQMLAVARGFVMRPRVLMIDELSLGLAPLIVRSIFEAVRTLADEYEIAVLLVEQHVELALTYADRAVVMNRGRIALNRPAVDLIGDRALLESAYLGAGKDGRLSSTP